MGPKALKLKYRPNWRETSKQEKEKPGFRCQYCGRHENLKHGVFLSTHHLDGNTLNDRAENLRVLCNRCHLRAEQKGNPRQLWFKGMKEDWAKDRDEFFLNLRKMREEDY